MAQTEEKDLLQTYPIPVSEPEEKTMVNKSYIWFLLLTIFSLWITSYYM